MTPALRVDGLCGGYPRLRVFSDVRLGVDHGEIVSLLGANGSGKSALLQTVQGLLTAEAGAILLEGRRIERLSPEERADAGMILVSDRRWLWPDMRLREHLWLGAFRRRARPDWRGRMAELRPLFPQALERPRVRPSRLSGGLQQQVTLARFAMASPRVWLLDDPLQGLDDITRVRVLGWIRSAAAAGAAVIVTGQHVRELVEISDRAMLLWQGTLVAAGQGGDAPRDARVRELL